MMLSGFAFIILLAGYIAVYTLATELETIDLFANIAQFLGLSVAAFQFLRARNLNTDLQLRKAFLLFFFGICFWALGQLLVLYSEILLRRVSTGSVSSVYFLIGYSLHTAALFQFVNNFARSDSAGSKKAWIFAGILVLILAAVIAKPVFSDHTVSTSLGLNVLYAAFDLMLIGLCFYLFLMARITRNIQKITGHVFLLAGFSLIGACNFIGMDAEFDTPQYHLLGLFYMASYFLISLAGAMFARKS